MNRFPDFAVACGEGAGLTVLHDGEPVRVDEFAATSPKSGRDLAAVRELGVEIWATGCRGASRSRTRPLRLEPVGPGPRLVARHGWCP